MDEPTARAPLPSRPTTARRLDALEDGLRTLTATVEGHITGHMAEHHRADGILEGVMQTVDTLANALTVNGAQAKEFSGYIVEAREKRATREVQEAEQAAKLDDQAAKLDRLLAWQDETKAEQARVQALAQAALDEDRLERKHQADMVLTWIKRIFTLVGTGILVLLPSFYVSDLPPSEHATFLVVVAAIVLLSAATGAVYRYRGRG